MVESNSEAIVADADKEDVAFLVVGDPFSYVCLGTFMGISTDGLQGNDTHRSSSSLSAIDACHPNPCSPRRFHLDRDWMYWTVTVQLWSDHLHGILHRLLATDKLLSTHC